MPLLMRPETDGCSIAPNCCLIMLLCMRLGMIYIHTYVRTYIHTYICTCIHTYIHIYKRGMSQWFFGLAERRATQMECICAPLCTAELICCKFVGLSTAVSERCVLCILHFKCVCVECPIILAK